MIVLTERLLNEKRLTFMDRLKSSKVGDTFNIYSGSKNYVVTQISSDRFKIYSGKGYDKSSDSYLNKCYISGSDKEITRLALQNFIKMINRKNGWRENLKI